MLHLWTYDKVCREELWRVLHECEIDGCSIRSMSSLYSGSREYMRLGNSVRGII